MTPTELVKAVLRSSDEGHFEALRALLDPDCEWINPMAQATGAAEVIRALTPYGEGFPERRHHVSSMLEWGDTVAVEGEWVATHTGPLSTPDGEVAPTGVTVRVPFAAVIRVRSGRVRSARIYLDSLGFIAQLGLVAEPAAP